MFQYTLDITVTNSLHHPQIGCIDGSMGTTVAQFVDNIHGCTARDLAASLFLNDARGAEVGMSPFGIVVLHSSIYPAKLERLHVT